MKILLVQPLDYLFSAGGAHKANRIILEGLAARGHDCRAVVPTATPGPEGHQRLLAQLAQRGITPLAVLPDAVLWRHQGVTITSVSAFPRYMLEVAREQEPDWLIVTEDRSFVLLWSALQAAPGRVVCLSHSQATMPFGPESFFPDENKTALLAKCAGVIAVSEYLRGYIRQYGHVESTVLRCPSYGTGPYPRFHNFNSGHVLMINPSAIKGISIFAALAERFPETSFAAVPTWATTPRDEAALRALPNIQLLAPFENMNELYARTRVLVVPSLWGESFGQIIVEAMLRGIPVMASDVGGIPEAKLGVDYLLPVRRIERYGTSLDSKFIPEPIVPEQDVGPWAKALERLLGDRTHYEAVSEASYRAAHAFVSSIGVEAFEQYLSNLSPPASRRPAASATSEASRSRALETLSPEKKALLALRLKKKNEARPQRLGIPRIPDEERHRPQPLSFGQQRLWFLEKLQPENLAYNAVAAYRLRGRLDRDALAWALQEIARRHEALRTRFPVIDGAPFQVVEPETAPLPIRAESLHHLPAEAREQAARELCIREACQPFDLERGPLVRALLLELGEEEHGFAILIHHIICDGWSVGVFFRELIALYSARLEGKTVEFPPLPIQYVDYALWQREWLRGEVLEKQLAYWRGVLGESPSPLELPADHPRQSATTRGARLHLALSRKLSKELAALARTEGCTLFMTLLSAFKVLLHRYTGQERIIVGSTIAHRNRVELEELIGFFVNTLVLHTDVGRDPSFRELMHRVREMTAGAYAHQELPFEQLVRELRLGRDTDRNPLFEITFEFHNTPMPRMELPALAIESLPLDIGTTVFDLSLQMWEGIDCINGYFEFNTALFEEATVRRLARHFVTLLEAAAARPDQSISTLPMLEAEERRYLLKELNPSSKPTPRESCFHELFSARARSQPDAVAALCQGETLSYGELEARSNQLAHVLRAEGLQSEDVVALHADRGLDFLTAMLAIFKAGAAYTPIDPDYPAARVRQMVMDSQARLVIACRRTASDVREALRPEDGGAPAVRQLEELLQRPAPRTPPDVRVWPSQLAYVLFTSGSTGIPKGAMLQHDGMLNHLYAKVYDLEVTAGDGIAQNASQSFDISIWQFLTALVTGGRVHIYPDDIARDALGLMAAVRRDKVTLLEVVPSMLRMMLEAGETAPADFPSLRWLLLTGEALPPELARRWMERHPSPPLLNAYGPTECSDDVTHYALREPPAAHIVNMPIGWPVANMRIHLLDRNLEPVPVGVAGELYVGGIGVGRGYLRCPEQTALAFVPDPFSPTPGTRMYRTGDRARYVPDGRGGAGPIEFLGRVDHQVKIRGFRIELGEIEAVLSRHPHVRGVAILAQEDRPGVRRLVAYVVPAPGERPSFSELRAHVRQSLPEYMVPAAVVWLDTLPTSPNGKVDRKALAALRTNDAEATETRVAPRTPAEQHLARIWADVLGKEEVGVDDNFFELGGDSILTIRIAARAREVGLDITPRLIFRHQTIATLAAALTPGAPAPQAPQAVTPPAPEVIQVRLDADSRQELLRQLAGSRPEVEALADIEAIHPLFPMQQGMLFHTLSSPVRGLYVEQLTCSMDGGLDVAAFQHAWDTLVARHAALRTSFLWERLEQPVQVVHRTASTEWRLEDLRHMSPEAQRERLSADIQNAKEQGLALNRAPLMQFNLYQVSDDRYMFRWAFHHLLMDGWSSGQVLQQMSALYEAFREHRTVELPPTVPNTRYLEWLERQEPAAAQAFWREELAGYPGAPVLRAARALTTRQTYQYAEQYFELSEQDSRALERFARERRVTLNTLIQAAWALLLGRYLDTSDVVFGVTCSGRPPDVPGMESLVGLFISTLPLRVGIPAEEELDAWLRQILEKQATVESFSYSSLTDIQQWSGVGRERPLFETLLVFANYPFDEGLRVGGAGSLRAGDVRGHEQTNYPLTVFAMPGRRFALGFSYDLGRFSADFMRCMLRRFQYILEVLLRNPPRLVGDLDLCEEPERHRMLEEWNPVVPNPPRLPSFPQLFAEQVTRAPGATALVRGEESMTYGGLDTQADRLARLLRQRGVRPGACVGVCTEAGFDRIVAVLGIWKAGAVYLPLDPVYPAERLRFMVEDARAVLLLAGRAQAPLFGDMRVPLVELDPAEFPNEAGDGYAVAPEDAAYIIYTSGSTGRPKGVRVAHGGLSNLVLAQRRAFQVEPGSRVLQFAALNFDASISEIAVTLGAGAELCLATRDERMPGPGLFELLKRQRITHVTLTPSALALLPVAPLPALRVLVAAGEPCSAELVARWAPGRIFLNAYGPTEASVCATIGMCEEDGLPPSIGRAMDNVRVYVLDERLRPVPIGLPGEICIGGPGVAEGYLHQPELTASVFIPDPFAPGGRMYRTGDRGRFLPGGQLEFLGRRDGQVKIRGFRVEVGEIEHRLKALPAVADAAVSVVPDAEGAPTLAAYVVPREPFSTAASRPGEAARAPELWPSVAEFYVYDDLLYHAMTNDHLRNERYKAALLQHVPGKVVVEIGTGKDAILARFCAEAGARKVYAIERSATTYAQARDRVEELGLSDIITVIHGDATQVTLPEKADVSVSEIVGAIGGSEGAAVIINQTRHLLTEDATIIPSQSITRIAALQLPETLRTDPCFTEVSGHYVRKIFEEVGRPFDLRLCIKKLPAECVLSGSGPFEELDYRRPLALESRHTVSLPVERDGRMDGFVVWLTLETTPGEQLDILNHEHCWLPVFVPAFEPGLEVRVGDRIDMEIARRLCTNGLNPDFHLRGRLLRRTGEVQEFTVSSYHQTETFQGQPFYERLFASGDVPIRRNRQPSEVTRELKESLPDFMVPSYVVLLDALPHSPSGKLDRHALPAPGQIHASGREVTPARTALERELVQLWEELLGIQPIGIHDDFFALGGHSLLAVRLLTRLQRQFRTSLSLSVLVERPTIAQLTEALRGEAPGAPALLLPMRDAGRGRPPLFSVPGAGGMATYLHPLARRLGENRPVYGLQAQALDGAEARYSTVEGMAEAFLAAVKTVQPEGPYWLGGHSLGGLVAFEMARHLRRRGEPVALVALFDTLAPMPNPQPLGQDWDEAQWTHFFAETLGELFGRPLPLKVEELRALSPAQQLDALAREMERVDIALPRADLERTLRILRAHQRIQYVPEDPSDIPLVLFRADAPQPGAIIGPAEQALREDPAYGWGAFTRRPVRVVSVPGNHLTLLAEPHVSVLARELLQAMATESAVALPAEGAC